MLPIVDASDDLVFETFRIGDLAKRVGKSARAVRLYEEKGLLGPAERTEGGHRVYGEDALARLKWIEQLQLLGLSLGDIRAFLDRLRSAETAPLVMEQARELFELKLSSVREQVVALQAIEAELSRGLAYLASCETCAPSTEVTACKSCGHNHPVEPPPLVMGIHQTSEGK
ncbi:MAG: MerR family transcriptional regulator [Myxococcales bacterium]|nr:MerR family transcriptional regulator [Myxococcales bacterium]